MEMKVPIRVLKFKTPVYKRIVKIMLEKITNVPIERVKYSDNFIFIDLAKKRVVLNFILFIFQS